MLSCTISSTTVSKSKSIPFSTNQGNSDGVNYEKKHRNRKEEEIERILAEFGKKINRFICFTNITPPKKRLLRKIMTETGGHGEAEIKKCLRLEILGPNPCC